MPAQSGRFRFEAGSYGAPGGGFAPSILCLKRVGDDEWKNHFVLANPDAARQGEQNASDLAVAHLDLAFVEKSRTGSDEAMAMKLRVLGYSSVENFRIADFTESRHTALEHLWPTSLAADIDAGMDDEERDLDHNPFARAAILEAVDEQIQIDDPRETRRSLLRLTNLGIPEPEAKELIATILAAEIYHVIEEKREFDREGYESALLRLPDVPEELRED